LSSLNKDSNALRKTVKNRNPADKSGLKITVQDVINHLFINKLLQE